MSDGDVEGRLVDVRFRLVTPLGRGQAGQVWHAVDEQTGEPVAVKIHRGRPVDELTAQLRHPCVVSTFFLGTHEGATYTVMELVEGVSLATVLEEGPIPYDDAVAIAIGVCEALQAAHAAGVVHGNLKPSNVLITDADGKQPVVKVSDFTGHGHPHEDMYSLGVLMETMSGRSDPNNRDPIVERLLSREPYSPAELRAILVGSPRLSSSPAEDEPETERPRLLRLAVITGAVTLTVVIALCAWFLNPSAPPDIRSQMPFGESAPSNVDSPAQPSASPVASRPPAAAPAVGANVPSAVSAAKAVIARQLKAGNIESDAAGSLNAKLDEIGRFLSRGQTKQANDRVDSLKTMLLSMRRSNRVNSTGYEAILAAFNDLSG